VFKLRINKKLPLLSIVVVFCDYVWGNYNLSNDRNASQG